MKQYIKNDDGTITIIDTITTVSKETVNLNDMITQQKTLSDAITQAQSDLVTAKATQTQTSQDQLAASLLDIDATYGTKIKSFQDQLDSLTTDINNINNAIQ